MNKILFLVRIKVIFYANRSNFSINGVFFRLQSVNNFCHVAFVSYYQRNHIPGFSLCGSGFSNFQFPIDVKYGKIYLIYFVLITILLC